MTDTRTPEPFETDEERRLDEALRGTTDRAPFEVPREIDAAIVSGFFQEAVRVRRDARRSTIFRLVPFAAAALLLVAVAVGPTLFSSGERTVETVAVEPMDADRSGSVDIVDAYLVARRLRRGESIEGRWDLDGDGVIGRLDVEAIARAAVSLERSAR